MKLLNSHLTLKRRGRRDCILLSLLNSHQCIPQAIEATYVSWAKAAINASEQSLKNLPLQRIHGDCHLGNLLDDQGQFVFLDFDDMVMGPCVQDTWLLFSEERFWQTPEFFAYEDGYNTLSHFDRTWLNVVPALRALRVIHYSAWVLRRLDDPAFTQLFAHVKQSKFWEDQIPTLQQACVPLEAG